MTQLHLGKNQPEKISIQIAYFLADNNPRSYSPSNVFQRVSPLKFSSRVLKCKPHLPFSSTTSSFFIHNIQWPQQQGSYDPRTESSHNLLFSSPCTLWWFSIFFNRNHFFKLPLNRNGNITASTSFKLISLLLNNIFF